MLFLANFRVAISKMPSESRGGQDAGESRISDEKPDFFCD